MDALEREVERLRMVLDSTRSDMWAGFSMILFCLVLLIANSFQVLQHK